MKRKLGHITIALLLFFGCTKEEVSPRVYPRVSTTEAFDITSGGATFKGEITFSNVEIKDHGFVWSDATGPKVNTSNKISLGARSSAGQFDVRCERSLEEGKKYYLRAYAISDDFTVYGETVEFVSLGGKAPVVKDFFPSIGTWSDSVTIVGENFSDEKRINIVKFGSATATVLRSNKDTLLVGVPFDLADDFTKITVSVAGNSSSIEDQYQLKAPIIESVTPDKALPGSKVVIKGKYLSSGGTKIFFGDTQAALLTLSSIQLECTVPNRPNGDAPLKVQTGTGSLFATTPFTIQPEHLPELHNVEPAVAKPGETIKLTGDFFGTEPGQNTVKFGNTEASIVSQTKTQIEVVVPYPETRTPTITVTSFGSSVSINTFAIKSPVVTDYSPHRGAPGNELIITGSDFLTGNLKVFLDDVQLNIEALEDDKIHTRVPPETKHTGTVKVVFYDQEFVLSTQFKSPWALLEAFPGYNLDYGNVLLYNNAAYFTNVGFVEQNDEVWKFDANGWTQLNDFPGTARERLFSFVLGNKGFVGGGVLHTTEKISELWEYDFANDSWTEQAEIPLQYDTPFGFAIGTDGYAFDRADMDPSKLWRYNSTADTWSQKSVAPADATGIMLEFVIGNSVYLIDQAGPQYFWKYTPSTNQWTNLGSPPSVFTAAFAMGGFGYASNGGHFYKYNPSNNTWTQEIAPTVYSAPVAGFSINGKGYLVSPWSYSRNYEYVYEYDPNY